MDPVIDLGFTLAKHDTRARHYVIVNGMKQPSPATRREGQLWEALEEARRLLSTRDEWLDDQDRRLVRCTDELIAAKQRVKELERLLK
jgi:hypothetical protein